LHAALFTFHVLFGCAAGVHLCSMLNVCGLFVVVWLSLCMLLVVCCL